VGSESERIGRVKQETPTMGMARVIAGSSSFTLASVFEVCVDSKHVSAVMLRELGKLGYILAVEGPIVTIRTLATMEQLASAVKRVKEEFSV